MKSIYITLALIAALSICLPVVCGADVPNFSLPTPPSPNYLFEQGENDSRAALIKGLLTPHGGAAIRWFNITYPPVITRPLYVSALLRGIEVKDDMIPPPTAEEVEEGAAWPMKAAERWLCVDVVKFRSIENMYTPTEGPDDDRDVSPERELELRTFHPADPTDEKVSRQCFEYKLKDDLICASAQILAEGETEEGFVGARVGVHCGFEDYECQFGSIDFGLFISVEPRDICSLIAEAREKEIQENGEPAPTATVREEL